MRKVLIANRGEIAVRIARACRDAGLTSVAVYADPDRDAVHVRVADEAFALGGATSGETYLDVAKLLAVAEQSGADAVHPGYGFLAENAGFAQAVLDAGLTWIGPPPAAIDALGRQGQGQAHRAEGRGAAGPGHPRPGERRRGGASTSPASTGCRWRSRRRSAGAGAGSRSPASLEEIPALFDSAVREAVAAFGRGECFVERYLDRPRHVETQCLADTHGAVVVVSTRDCSLQRRHQKLVEEAPAPFLSDDQVAELYRSSKAILVEAGYVGAGTCEFLVGPDGTVSFLEVNTRLQVEHCVSEEVTGIDLVREQLRIADGEPLGYDDPPVRGHSVEFRINGEDAGRGFLPAPGAVTVWRPPAGPGVRLDSGVEQGSVIGGQFDSMLAKLIVTGADRRQAMERARRALAEFEIEGMPTVLPFHRAVVVGSGVRPGRSRASRSLCTPGGSRPSSTTPSSPTPGRSRQVEAAGEAARAGAGHRRGRRAAPGGRAARGVRGGVRGRRSGWPAREPGGADRGRDGVRPRDVARAAAPAGAGAADGTALTSPMQGTVVSIVVEDGQQVAAGDPVLVLEAMKMEQPVTAHRAGVISALAAEVGVTVTSGAVLCQILDADA